MALRCERVEFEQTSGAHLPGAVVDAPASSFLRSCFLARPPSLVLMLTLATRASAIAAGADLSVAKADSVAPALATACAAAASEKQRMAVLHCVGQPAQAAANVRCGCSRLTLALLPLLSPSLVASRATPPPTRRRLWRRPASPLHVARLARRRRCASRTVLLSPFG